MTIDYNLLSGATINSELRLLYNILSSGDSYLGFSRNFETWGQGCLVKYKAATNQSWPSGIIGDATNAQIYDENHRLLNLSNNWKNVVSIAKYDKSIGIADVPPNASSPGIIEWVPSINQIEVIFINQDWMLLRGVDPVYPFSVFGLDGTTEYSYFIFNSDLNENNILQIEKVDEFQFPGLSTKVQMRYAPVDSSTPWEASLADPVPGASDLERRLNILGEYIVTGIGQEFVTWMETDIGAKNATFFLTDVNGSLLLDRFTYEETYTTESEIAYIFAYYIQEVSQSGATILRKVRFKVTTQNNINSRMAVFHESLPVANSIAPVADNNPPGLQISYIRHPAIHTSIFDVVGLEKINAGEVWYAKEIAQDTTAELQYFLDLEATLADPTKLTVDEITIDVDAVTNEVIKKYYAITQNFTYAVQFGCAYVMINKEVAPPAGAPPEPTGEIYRQLFVSWLPRYFDTSSQASYVCGEGPLVTDHYAGRSQIFDTNLHTVDLGTVFYLANKIPVYRKYLTGNEIFKIIL